MPSYHWSLVITFCDVKNNVFLKLGAASWRTKRERDRSLASIPSGRENSPYILDIESARGIEDDRLIDAATVEKLMGKPLTVLIADARADLASQEGR